MAKVLFWSFVFSVFGVYATTVLTQAYGAPQTAVAYAKTIEKEIEKEHKKSLQVVKKIHKKKIYVEASPPKKNPFIRILERLNLRAQKERELCEVTEEQLQSLKESHTFDMEEVDVAGEKVQIAKSKDTLSTDQLQRFDVHCLKLSIIEHLILLLSAHVS